MYNFYTSSLYTGYHSVSLATLDGEHGVVCWEISSYYVQCSVLEVAAGSTTISYSG